VLGSYVYGDPKVRVGQGLRKAASAATVTSAGPGAGAGTVSTIGAAGLAAPSDDPEQTLQSSDFINLIVRNWTMGGMPMYGVCEGGGRESEREGEGGRESEWSALHGFDCSLLCLHD
jgi:hypothetical protein